ncbi:hypothetical protein [Xanthomonas sacchari]|uniref:hypothetical protein n=1 Tax=Xanthomonas sacchari TaxID=56458 RepID=UPI0020C33511|nr:hypothetical protein [Xanthomonas sacchari]
MAQLLAALQGGWVAGDTARQVATRAAAASAPISAAQDSGSLAALASAVAVAACGGADAAGTVDAEAGAAAAAACVSASLSAAGAGAPSRPHPDSANAAVIQKAHVIFRIGVSCRRSGNPRRRSAPGIVGSDTHRRGSA